MAHTRAAVLAYPAPEILRIEHSQANPLKLSLAWAADEEMPSGLTLRAEIHPSRSVADDAIPLSAVTLDITDADTQPWTLEFSSQQTNLDLGGRDWKAFVLTISGIESSTRFYSLADADLILFRHPCSQLVPPAVSPLLYATTEDLDDLEARVTVIEETGGGGATNLAAVPSPTNVIVTSDTGNDATIPAADGTNAGLMLPAEKTKLAGVASGATANATDSQLRDRSTHTGTQAISTIANLQLSLDGKAASSHTHAITDVTNLATTLSAKADLVGGKLDAAQLPDLAVTQYLGAAANQSAMLLLVGQRGDWCVRSDDGKVYVVTGEPSSTLSNWTSLSYPTAPVLSVAGKTGSVTLAAGDIGDSTAVGRALLTALDNAAQRGALGLGALATLATVGTAQIDNGSVAASKLANTTVSPGTYTLASLTVDAQGRITSASSGTAGTPAGSGSEIQFRNAGSFGAVTGSSVSGGVVTFAELRVNNGTATTGLRVTADAAVTSLFFNGTGTDGFIYGGAGAGTNAVAIRGSVFRIEGSGATDSLALLQIGNGNRVLLRARTLNNLALGPADAAAASLVAQNISVQSATGSNQSASAAVFTLDGAQGTGTGAGGDVRIRVAPNGSTGSTQNALVEAVRWRATDLASVCAGAVIAGGPVVLPAFTVATVPSVSLWARGLIYVSDEIGGPTPAFSDGTNWRRVADRAVVAIA